MTTTIRPDSKGRITLGKFAKGISSFRLHIDANNCIVLEPMVEIPASELWVHENKDHIKSIRKGLKESKEGQIRSLGSFAQHVEKDDLS